MGCYNQNIGGDVTSPESQYLIRRSEGLHDTPHVMHDTPHTMNDMPHAMHDTPLAMHDTTRRTGWAMRILQML